MFLHPSQRAELVCEHKLRPLPKRMKPQQKFWCVTLRLYLPDAWTVIPLKVSVCSKREELKIPCKGFRCDRGAENTRLFYFSRVAL